MTAYGAGQDEPDEPRRSPAAGAGIDPGWVERLMADLFPLCRSITGDGTRATLRRIASEIEFDVHEVPTGTPVLDWQVPDEWNLRRAVLWGPQGEVLADTDASNLHVVGYSVPTRARLSLSQLANHVHSAAETPAAIPYRTAYYARTWGFCVPYEVHARMEPGWYEVDVDTSLEPGSLTYGELVIPGIVEQEIMVSTHVCHPSLANDNLSGIAAATALARWALETQRRYTYRFLFVPATIGVITWLAGHAEEVANIVHGLVITGVGDRGPLTYKRSRRGDTATDRVMERLLAGRGTVIDWYPYGYDERQYCSPGLDLPVGRLSRTLHGSYPEYHTSADDLSFVSPAQVLEAVAVVIEAFERFEARRQPLNLSPRGEPQLGRRGLFTPIGGAVGTASTETTYLWVLSLADGHTDLDEIADRSGLPLDDVMVAAERLRDAGLLADF